MNKFNTAKIPTNSMFLTNKTPIVNKIILLGYYEIKIISIIAAPLSIIKNLSTMPTSTIADLLTTPAEIQEFIHHLNRSMLYMVLYLKYEPEMLDNVIESYDSLHLLQQALENYQPHN